MTHLVGFDWPTINIIGHLTWLNHPSIVELPMKVAWANKPMAYTHISVEVEKAKMCLWEDERNKDVKFIQFSIVTVVYNNGINLKILMSH